MQKLFKNGLETAKVRTIHISLSPQNLVYNVYLPPRYRRQSQDDAAFCSSLHDVWHDPHLQSCQCGCDEEVPYFRSHSRGRYALVIAFTRLPVFLETCLPFWKPACLPACLPVCLPASLPDCLPESLFAFLETCLIACLHFWTTTYAMFIYRMGGHYVYHVSFIAIVLESPTRVSF